MPISFLILTYNSSSYIYSLLDSLSDKVGNSIRKGEYEIIIFDNASSDDTTDKISKYLKDKKEWDGHIQFVKNSQNLGYAKGINMAAKKAKGDLLVVINPDAELIEADFKLLIDSFEKDKKMAAAGLRLVNLQGKNEKTAGKFYNPLTFLLFSLGLENLFNIRFAPEESMTVDYVSGGFIAIRKETFEQLKGYDEDYFMYVEDMDLCYRIKKMGMKTVYMPSAIIRHAGQGSSSREFAIVNIYRGLQIFYTKHSSLMMQQYVKNLLSLKAALIIFISTALGKRDLVSVYSHALKTIV